LVPVKRFDLFLQILARLDSKYPVKGVIAGDGPLRAELEAQAGRLGLFPGKVEFAGRLSDPVELYRKASVLLLTSDFEGTPNVVLEAMASGVPIVATRVGDVPELLCEGERGCLATAGDVDGLVSAIGSLLENPETRARLAGDGCAYVQSQHSHTALKDHLAKLYSLTLAA
jgi:glycosyltransferase involved in cell wall biosynthesis